MQWALGNTLLRKGSTDEAFDLIAKAVDGNPSYREPAAGLAWIIFEGDVEAVRRAMGDSPPVIAALASTLAREERFDDAVRLWEQLPADEKRGRFKEVGAGLLAKLTAGSRFRQAMSVAASLGEGENAPSEIGRITNGGFESDVRIPATELFNWRIEDGLSPQIVVDAGNKQEGTRSLVIIIDSPDGRLTRSVTQTVAVEPGANYLFTAFYRSDTDSAKGWQWEVVDAAKRQPVAATPSTQAKADWTPLSVRFTAPSEVDGIIIRLVRAECGSPICPVKGRIWFDGLSLEKVAE
ncbi:MAG: hypothetical protein LOY00_13460 [Methylocaldum sp.]|nr:hypothetical protein [Methylocaldum sp.]